MKRLFLLFGVVISLLFSTPFTFSSIIALSAAENIDQYSSVQEDLDKFGIDEEKYEYRPLSNEQISCLLFAETKNNEEEYYYYLYLYLPTGFIDEDVPKNYNKVQIGYSSANNDSLLDSEDLLAINSYNLSFLSLSDNKTVAKYIIKDFDPAIKKPYRRYQIRRVNCKDNTYFPLGDEYFYYNTTVDNVDAVAYEYKKMNYLTLDNVHCASYILKNDSFFEDLFNLEYDTQQSFFYGFDIENFKIDELYEVDFIYEYNGVSGIQATLNGEMFDDPVGQANVKKLIDEKGINPDELVGEDLKMYQFTMALFGGYAPIYGTPVVVDTPETITPEEVKVEGTKGFLNKSYSVKWNTISTYNECVDNSNDSFADFIKKYFKDCDYLVNFKNFKITINENTTNTFDRVGAWLNNDKAWDRLYNWLRDQRPNYPTNYPPYYEVNKYDCNQVEAVRMKFNSAGTIYDLSVITNPVDSEGDYVGKGNKSWFEELWEQLCDWVEETFDTVSPFTELIAGIIVLISLIALILLVIGIIKMLVSGFFKILIDGIVAIFKAPFTPFRKKDNHDYYDRR